MLEKSTYYILDAQGNQLSMYDYLVDTAENTAKYYLSERNIYGSSRLGTLKDPLEVFSGVPLPSYGTVGNRNYELTNHLGNVLTVINDIKYPLENNGTITGYETGISHVFDYSPFGAPLDGRTIENIFHYPNSSVDTLFVSDTLFVINNDFENPVITTNGVSTFIDGWKDFSQSTISIENTGGNNQLKVVSTNGTHGIHQTFAIENGETYTFEVDLTKVSVPSGVVNVVIYQGPSPGVPYSVHVLSSNGTNTFSYTANSSDIYVQIRQSGTYLLDNIRLYREYEDTVIVGGYAASGGYHYSFQNQEKHDEIRGKGKYINYKYRGYDPRVGRLDWMVDPLAAKYPYYSPYAFSGNRVLDAMELEGLEPLHNKSGKIDKQHYKVAGVINVRDGQKVYVYQLLNSPTFVISKEGADKLVGAGYTYSKNPQKYVTTEFNDDETNLRLVTYIDGVSPTTSEDLKEFGTVFSTATITGNNHLLNQIQNENLIAMETLPITNPIKPEAGSPNNNDVKIGDRVVPPGGDLWVNINAQFDANTTNINNLSEINGAITNIANALNANPSNTITIFGSANLPPSTDWNTINTRAGISFGQLADQRNQTIANLLIRQGVNPSQINMQRGRTDAMRVNGNFRNAAPSTD